MKKICLGFLLVWAGWVASALGTTYNVNSNFDDGSNNTIVGTIRYAVNQANTQPGGPHVVNLNAGGNSITVCSQLLIAAPMTFFGRGNTVGAISSSLTIFNVIANYCTFSNLVIRNGSTGIQFQGSGNQIWASLVTNNSYAGIFSTGYQNTIGGTSDANRNYIVGNPNFGILGQIGFGLVVQRNYIGINPDGTSNGNNTGIRLDNIGQCLIGGTLADGNVISGSTNYGVCIMNAANGNTVCGNIIGLNPGQTAAYANDMGVYVHSSPGNWIGLSQANSYNVIAGNSTFGIYVFGVPGPRCQNTIIQNNYIGLSAAGGAFANGTGIKLAETDSCLIGGNRGTGSYDKNIISNNTAAGINLSTSNGNTVGGNYIGTNIAGTSSMGNGTGIVVNYSSHNNLIGGANLSAGNQLGNVVAGNMGDEIDLTDANSNSVVGNYLGLTADGNTSLFSSGVTYSLKLDNSFGCLVGGTPGTLKNIFSEHMNLTNGSSGNTVVGNWFGAFANGSLDTNSFGLLEAISINNNAPGNLVGLKNGGGGNLIAYANAGISLNGAGTVNNGLFGNTICASQDPTSNTLIFISGNANNNKLPPTISSANAGVVTGHAQSGDYVEVFKAARGAGFNGGSLAYLGSAIANGSGVWNVSVAGLATDDYVCALASDGANNTSGFCLNYRYGPPYTPTITPSSTVTPTPTVSATGTITPTNTMSPTISATGTISPTFTISPTLTVSPTRTPTTTATLTASPTTTNSLAGVNGILAFPNPGKKQVKFVLHLDQATEAKIDIYNINGELAAKLTASLPAGRGQVITWDCSQVGAGVYVAKVFLGDKLEKTLKVAVVR